MPHILRGGQVTTDVPTVEVVDAGTEYADVENDYRNEVPVLLLAAVKGAARFRKMKH